MEINPGYVSPPRSAVRAPKKPIQRSFKPWVAPRTANKPTWRIPAISTETLILGASNLSRITKSRLSHSSLSICSFPGAKFQLCYQLCQDVIPGADKVKNLVLSFGLINDQWFLQTSGTAMGKRYAPSFANIFMANLEDEVLRKAKCKPLAMFRFIDDIFFIWNHSRDELTEFINLCNTHDNSIKIDCNINETSVDFLDVTIFKGSGFSNHNILDTKFKETDTHELLHKKSFHPKHTFEGILKSQLIRFLTICNNKEDFHEATSILFKVLREKRHYSGRFLRQIKARFLRNYRQPGNTLDPIGAALKCKSSRCQCCLYFDEKSHFSNYDFDFPIFGGLNCLSKHIIYIIECKACGDKYVGETGRCLKDRMFNHISDTRRDKNGPVSRHFNNADNICFGAEYNMILYPIEQIPDQGNAQRNKSLGLKRELHWIKTLGTQFPHGMNHKIVRNRDIFITFPFSNNAREAFKITKDICIKLQKNASQCFQGRINVLI